MKNVAIVFKVIIGSLVVIVLSSVIIEFLNMTLISTFLRGTITKVMEKSCDLFAQETYIKSTDTANVSNLTLSDIVYGTENCKDITGIPANNVAVSSNWFPSGTTADNFYDKLYVNNNNYKSFLRQICSTNKITTGDVSTSGVQVKAINAEISHPWQNMNRIANYILDGENNIACSTNNYSESKITARAIGKTYVESYVTPINQGITYLDIDTLTKITKWSLVSSLSNGMSQNVHPGYKYTRSGMVESKAYEPINSYVEYSGYRVYYNTFQIKGIEYDIYDLMTADSRAEFVNQTHISDGNSKYWTDLGLDSLGNADNISEERRYVCVAKVHYNMTIAYDGVTKIKNIINFFARGTNGNQYSVNGYGTAQTGVNTKLTEEDVDVTEDLIYRSTTGGNASSATFKVTDAGNYQLADFNSEVIYYIVR